MYLGLFNVLLILISLINLKCTFRHFRRPLFSLDFRMSPIIQYFTIVTNIFSIIFILITYLFTFTYQFTVTRKKLLHYNLIQLMRNMGRHFVYLWFRTYTVHNLIASNFVGFCWIVTLTGTLLVLVSFLMDSKLLGMWSIINPLKLQFRIAQADFQQCRTLQFFPVGLDYWSLRFGVCLRSNRVGAVYRFLPSKILRAGEASENHPTSNSVDVGHVRLHRKLPVCLWVA